MMKRNFIFFACLLQFSTQRSTPQDDSYIAAVLEYQVTANMRQNLQNYMQHIDNAAQQNADIVVFPEMTLTTSGWATPVPIHSLLKEYPVPAARPDLYDQVLVNMSSAALQNQVYVVVNIQEELDCTNSASAGEECPEEIRYIFNTNVVFDRNGAVIDRYRKINLFGEFTRTPALKPDLGIFTTDFGVTFGHFICFDLMFQVPAVQIVEKHNLTDIIFTTMWFSEMPYLTAVQIQESYAYALNINFLASGANNVRVGSAGSGIYSGKAGALVSIMPGLPTTRLLVSRVPKTPGQVNYAVPGPIYDNPSDHDSLALISDLSLPAHASRPLVPGFQEFTLVDKEVSCKFTVRLNQRAGETIHQYRAFVHDGTNTYSRRQVGVASCAVVACEDSEAKSCGYKFSSTSKTVEIQELEIEMRTHKLQYNETLKCDNVVYFPSSFTINHYPLSQENFTYARDIPSDNQNIHRELIKTKINKSQDELVSFGIWGRIYNRDVDYNKASTQEDIQIYMGIENEIFFPKNNDHYNYRAAAFDGVRSYSGLATGGIRVCSVLACVGEDIDSCGERFPKYEPNTTAIFEELSIEATMPTPFVVPELEAQDSAYFPLALNVNIMPLKPSDTTYSSIVQEGTTIYTLKLTNLTAELYSFAVWGRKFEKDGLEADGPREEPADSCDSSFVFIASPYLLIVAIMSAFTIKGYF